MQALLAVEAVDQLLLNRELNPALSWTELRAQLLLLSSMVVPDTSATTTTTAAAAADKLLLWLPIGSLAQRQRGPSLPGDWFDAVPFQSLYMSSSARAYHTGADLNRPNYKDSNEPVFAIAAGEVVFSGLIQGWQLRVVVIKHSQMSSPPPIWSRYAHLSNVVVKKGQQVQQGELLGNIGDYQPQGPASDHLHFDIAVIDLGQKPGDWPGVNLERLLSSYVAPLPYIEASWSKLESGG